jgi:hypothetical protein
MGMMDRLAGAAEQRDDLGTGKLARIRALLVAAEMHPRPDNEVLDDIALVVGKERRRDDIYQKPLG